MARQIGLRDIHIAVLTKDDSEGATYEKPEKLERAISEKLSPKVSSENIYSDDTVEDVITAFEGVDVEIEVNQLSIQSRAKLKGTFFARDFDDNYRFIADEDEKEVDKSIISEWFMNCYVFNVYRGCGEIY